MTVPRISSAYVILASRGDQSGRPVKTGSTRTLIPTIRSVRKPMAKTCRAASDHQRFWAGRAVRRERITPASSRTAHRPRNPKAERILQEGQPGARPEDDARSLGLERESGQPLPRDSRSQKQRDHAAGEAADPRQEEAVERRE